jgi:hypothetical protein
VLAYTGWWSALLSYPVHTYVQIIRLRRELLITRLQATTTISQQEDIWVLQ